MFDGYGDKPCPDELTWRVDGGKVRFFVNCNDLFDWGCADCEPLTPENFPELERAVADCQVISAGANGSMAMLNAASLFCCRRRGERPQGACYKSIDSLAWHLFDACGPLRAVGLGNPRRHPLEAPAV